MGCCAFEQKVGWVIVEWSGYPLDYYDYWSTCGAKKLKSYNVCRIYKSYKNNRAGFDFMSDISYWVLHFVFDNLCIVLSSSPPAPTMPDEIEKKLL